MIRVECVSSGEITVLVRGALREREVRILDVVVNGLLAVRTRELLRVAVSMRRAGDARVRITVEYLLRMIADGRAGAAEMSFGRLISAVLRTRMYCEEAL